MQEFISSSLPHGAMLTGTFPTPSSPFFLSIPPPLQPLGIADWVSKNRKLDDDDTIVIIDVDMIFMDVLDLGKHTACTGGCPSGRWGRTTIEDARADGKVCTLFTCILICMYVFMHMYYVWIGVYQVRLRTKEGAAMLGPELSR